jgi:ankyrin repeat protein
LLTDLLLAYCHISTPYLFGGHSWAARNGHEAVEKNADIGSKDNEYWAPLSWAACKGNEAVVKLLLDKNADLKSKDISANVILEYTAVSITSQYHVFDLVLRHRYRSLS